ncbi:hypothetical protein CXB51_025678 [Gossypium anomalum]|uniref:At4g15545-like C-terminal domain-containing protein n=1 Tax=Gossypium anomalum TaxID=47600 RepID=A0A8J5YR93_9ROSI|nr:hypothetical protein CXB51_025678 [Gossypium anomalum]
MLAKESGGSTFDLPEELLQVLPSDPFDQLDVARKITSIALSTRVSLLEAESSSLRDKLTEKTNKSPTCVPRSMLSRLLCLKPRISSLRPTKKRYESLLKDNASLSNTVRKLQRDVSKLEVFRRKLMQSLQEDDESSATGGPPIIAKPTLSVLCQMLTLLVIAYDDNPWYLPTFQKMILLDFKNCFNAQPVLDFGCKIVTQMVHFSHCHLFSSPGTIIGQPQDLLTSWPPASLTNKHTLALTPPGSPPMCQLLYPPQGHLSQCLLGDIQFRFSTSRGMFDDRSSISSSDSGSQSGRTRVDGKEFFRQVRSRLSYEQFGAFLANVKELNSHKQTREETLRKQRRFLARITEIFMQY